MASSVAMEDRFVGCLLAGACGDALGAQVEGFSIFAILNRFGPCGVRNFDVARLGVRGWITDDTQMTLFTAEGVMSAVLSFLSNDVDLKSFREEDAVPALHQSYLRWLSTQHLRSESPLFEQVKNRGMLVKQKGLQKRSGPGRTCLTSLESAGVGSFHNRFNDSKGCGGIMRVAPCALIVKSAFAFLTSDEQAELVFKLGCISAAITHTHPSGWLSAGYQAAMLSRILSGECLEIAIAQTTPLLEKEPENDETLFKVKQAQRLASEFDKVMKSATAPVADAEKQSLVLKHIGELGRGFIGEEALGIAMYCAIITGNDVESAICYAVNHSGDSDSTGAIVGNIMGALYGEAFIPSRWKDDVESADLIRHIATDLYDVTNIERQHELLEKYPPAITHYNGQAYYKNNHHSPSNVSFTYMQQVQTN